MMLLQRVGRNKRSALRRPGGFQQIDRRDKASKPMLLVKMTSFMSAHAQ
jgi:hypothetical protein